ncbi:MAG: ribonuclease HI [Planctomycetes bacterium]|nr:ribonuclease HI [Planctomycetota bacterium]
MPRIELYTDGACSGNPGPGGWACVLKHPATGSRKELSGGEAATTNNRMELRAAIEGLRLLKTPTRVDLTSDSKYVLDGLSSWLAGWKKQGWKTASKQPVKNQDLWQVLDELIQMHEVHFHWIKGHSAHPENERCDELAVLEAKKFGK